MVGPHELDTLKAAYVEWGKRGRACIPMWRAMMADSFRLASMDESAPGLSFAKDRQSADEAAAYLEGIFEQWDMLHYTPEHYLAQGDHIAVFGTCAYRNKATGKAAETRFACLWRFKGGKAVELFDIFDSARAVAAATP